MRLTLKHTQNESTPIMVGQQEVELRDQLRDYQFRGEDLAGLNFYRFMLDTYEAKIKGAETTSSSLNTDDDDTKKPGWRRNLRSCYLPEANKQKKWRVYRTSGHETLPRFIGRWFPTANDPNSDNELYSASILLLLKPWRMLSDLKHPDEAFGGALTHFLTTATSKEKDMIENIQYYHDCWEVAQKRRDALKNGKTIRLFDYEKDRDGHLLDAEDNNNHMTESEETEELLWQTFLSINEDMIESERLKQREERDRIFTKQVMCLAQSANIFNYDTYSGSRRLAAFPRQATFDDMQIFDTWAMTLQEMTRRQGEEEGITNLSNLHRYSTTQRNSQPSLQMDNGYEEDHVIVNNTTNSLSASRDICNLRPKLAILNDEQRRAHDIIEEKIVETIYSCHISHILY